DHSLVTSITSGILVNSGHLLENLVFSTIRRISSKIYYYKTKKGREVDFIAFPNKHSKLLIQVCESLSDPKTRKREITALNEAMHELGLKSGLIVTQNDNEKIKVTSGVIEVLPIWRFLLNFSD
ncbi:ATP-binding protein, partial [bacterium]|nr:ATP-binding protein [bacterium]